jgi:hypothetical protein
MSHPPIVIEPVTKRTTEPTHSTDLVNDHACVFVGGLSVHYYLTVDFYLDPATGYMFKVVSDHSADTEVCIPE